MYKNFIALVFILFGLFTVSHVHNKRRYRKSVNDWRGFIAGIVSTAFGIYLIYESIIE